MRKLSHGSHGRCVFFPELCMAANILKRELFEVACGGEDVTSLLGLMIYLETSCWILIVSEQLDRRGHFFKTKKLIQTSGVRHSFGYSISQPMTTTVLFLILTLCSRVAIAFQWFRCPTNNHNKMWHLEERFCSYTFESQTDLELLNQIVIVSVKVEFKMFPWRSQCPAEYL